MAYLRWQFSATMKCLLIVLALLAASPWCHAESWVEVKHGAFRVPKGSLAKVQATLKGTIALAMSSKGGRPLEWSHYLIRYRGPRVKGLRTIEIHGACHFEDTGYDPRSDFYDVSDGGECYFLVYHVLKTGRYSNVVFHGVA